MHRALLTQKGPTWVIVHPGSKRVVFIISQVSQLSPTPTGQSSDSHVTGSFLLALHHRLLPPSLFELTTPCQSTPSSFFSSMFSRFLLTAVALLSSYSIHLLLKSSGIVGESLVGLQRRGVEVGQALGSPDFLLLQASAPMSSWATVHLGPQGS